MNPVDLNVSAYKEFSVKNDEKDAKLELSDMLKYEFIKIFFTRYLVQISHSFSCD